MRSTIYIAAALAVLATSVAAAYSMWSSSLSVNGYVKTGELDAEFLDGSLMYLDACGLPAGYGYAGGNDWNSSSYPDAGAYQLDMNVACTDAKLIDTDGDGDYDALNITIHNAYPGYYTHVTFNIRNNGDIPLKIWRVVIDGKSYYEINEGEAQNGVEVDLNNDGKPDVRIWWGDNFGKELYPGDSAAISFDLTVLPSAPQGAKLTLTIKYEMIQWNGYSSNVPGP